MGNRKCLTSCAEDQVKGASGRFRVPEGTSVNLKKWPTSVKRLYRSKEAYDDLLAEHVAELSKLQRLLYASDQHALLLIFQAMDAAGKDGVIAHVMSGVNPQGCQVFSFKHPSAEELEHDFLWRTTRCLPERGRIGIFNRSYYEEVLIARVHPRSSAAKGSPRVMARRTTSGGDGMSPLSGSNATSIATGPGSSNSSCTSRRKNSGSDS